MTLYRMLKKRYCMLIGGCGVVVDISPSSGVVAMPTVSTVRTFRSPPVSVGFLAHWQRIAGYIRSAAATNSKLFDSISGMRLISLSQHFGGSIC
jgi:hypothetical protein